MTASSDGDGGPRLNSHGQPIGFPLPSWQACKPPILTTMAGNYCRLEPLIVDLHCADLNVAYSGETAAQNWTYLAHGPFENIENLRGWLQASSSSADALFYAIVESKSGKAVGVASYLRIDPEIGVIEVGNIHYSPRLQRTPAATEAMYLMMRRVFDELGYRRYEWKCDSLNAPSRMAAERLGFSFEGIFRQATMYKSRNRDTAWYSIIDGQWPELKIALERWLDTENFDDHGRQKTRLAHFFTGDSQQ